VLSWHEVQGGEGCCTRTAPSELQQATLLAELTLLLTAGC